MGGDTTKKMNYTQEDNKNGSLHMQNTQKSQFVASSYTLELARFSTLLRIQARAECGKGTELHFFGGWGNRTEKNIQWEWGHRTYFVDGENN